MELGCRSCFCLNLDCSPISYAVPYIICSAIVNLWPWSLSVSQLAIYWEGWYVTSTWAVTWNWIWNLNGLIAELGYPTESKLLIFLSGRFFYFWNNKFSMILFYSLHIIINLKHGVVGFDYFHTKWSCLKIIFLFNFIALMYYSNWFSLLYTI